MKALCWYGKKDVRVEKVPDPAILNPHDVIVDAGPEVKNVKKGDRVVVPFTIACGGLLKP